MSPEPPDLLSLRTDLATALSLLQRYELMADSMPALMAYYEYDGLRCSYANQAYAATFGHNRRSIVGQGLAEVIGADALRQIEPHIERMFTTRQTVSYTRTVRDAAGTAHQLEVSLVPHLGDGGDASAPPLGAFVLINDITRYHDAQQALRDGEQRLRRFMDASVEGIAFHRDGVVTDVNAPMLEMLGYRREDMLGRPVMDFVVPEHRPRAEQGYAHPSAQPYESALIDQRGEPVPVELIARMLPRDGDTLRMVVVRDIRDRQAARARMRHLAEHDALTGLRNRGAFMEALGSAIERHASGDPALALLFVDLDHFKHINDAHGHLAGDALLRGVAERLLARLRDGAVAGRFGGDEFVILMPEVAGRDEALDAGLRLLAAMAEPVTWGGQQLSVTPTIGVALYPDDGLSADNLLRHADAAMYAGKAAGRAVVSMFEPAMAAALESGQRWDARVAEGLAQGEFHLMLQPRLALAGGTSGLQGRLGGLQAVVRWRHPERGWLTPDDFVLVGRRRMLQTLLEWALQEALRLSTRWQALGVAVPLALNLHGLVPQAEGLAATVGRALAQQPMAETPLALELPEALLAGDRPLVRRSFEQLAQLGLPLWLDDFGQGGAALAELRHLPLTGLLIGPALVGGLPQDAAAAAVVRGIAALADGLGLPVCATGVATGAQAEALHGAGCRLLQGGWYEPPMSAADASAWLASGPR